MSEVGDRKSSEDHSSLRLVTWTHISTLKSALVRLAATMTTAARIDRMMIVRSDARKRLRRRSARLKTVPTVASPTNMQSEEKLMTPNQPFREAAKEFQVWVNQLKGEADLCISKMLDSVEHPSGQADSATRANAAWAIGQLHRRIVDVMSSYDAMLTTIGEETSFSKCIEDLRRGGEGIEG